VSKLAGEGVKERAPIASGLSKPLPLSNRLTSGIILFYGFERGIKGVSLDDETTKTE
jgi:hypothetical protein